MSSFNLPVAPIDLARGAAFLLGTLGVGVGVRGLLAPSPYAVTFGFPPQSSTIASATSNPFVPIAAGRAVSSSIGLLACVYLKYDKPVGVMLISGVLTAFFDGYFLSKSIDEIEEGKISAEERQAAKGKAWGHWGGMPLIGGLGIWLVLNS